MDDYWQETGQTATIQQSYQTPQQQIHQAEEDEFDFSANQNNYDSSNLAQSFNNMETAQYTSESQGFEEDEVTRQIREEEQKINQQLQQKANAEYELKQKRKQDGSRWLEEFFNKKQQQTHQRKEDNIRKQQQLINDIRNSQTTQGWTKVSKSIDLKQSEYKGSKDINRMREAILHKKEDESSI